MVQETTYKVVLIKESLRAARDHKNRYADNRRKLLEFKVGPFEILERIGSVAYRLRFPQELSSIHDTFHVSNLKKCLADANLHVAFEEITADKTLCFIEEPVEIMVCKVKKLKRSRIPIVKCVGAFERSEILALFELLNDFGFRLVGIIEIAFRSRTLTKTSFIGLKTVRSGMGLNSFRVEYHSLLKFKGDNTPIVIQPPCYRASKDEEEVSSDDNEMVEVKVLMALAKDNNAISKEGARNGECVKISMRKVHTLLEMEDNDDRKTYLDYLCIDLHYVEEQRNNLLSKHRDLVHELNTCKEQPLLLKQAKLDFLTMQHVNTEILKGNKNLRIELKELTSITKAWLNSSNKVIWCITDDTKVSIPGVERPLLSEAKYFILLNHDTVDESSVCSTPLPLLKKLDGAKPVSGPKTIKSIFKSKFTFKDETIKGVIINKPSSAPAKGNKSSSASKFNSAFVGKLKSVKIKDDPPLAIVIKELNDLKLQISKTQSSYSKNNQPQQCERNDHRNCDHAKYISTMNMIISLEREINSRNPSHTFKRCEACGSSTHTITNHYDIEWFRKGESFQAKKAKALKSTRVELSSANRSKTPTKRKPIWYLDSGCSRHMTGVKSYLHKYVEQPGPKVMFGDESTCITEGYGSIKCNGIVLTKFDEKRGTIFNSNKKVVMIALRVRDVYILDMTSSTQESCTLRNSILVNFCDEKGISKNFSSPYTPEQNGVAERKNRTLTEAIRTMLSGSVFSKQYWTEAIATACYTQNRSTIVKIYLKTPYEIFQDTLVQNTVLILNSSLSIPSMVTPAPQDRWSQDKHIELVNIIDFLPEEEPEKVSEALQHPEWVDAMQDELNQFSRSNARLIAQGNNQQEGIDYDETFAPVARLKAIRIFLAFTTYMNFIVYQMDVKSTFLNGKLKEVYVKQPPGFESSEFPNYVCKFDKALYGHKQAPRAWYLKGTPSLGIWYPKCSGFDLKGYLDSDYDGCNRDKKALQNAQLSLYTSGHLEVSELAACLEKLHFLGLLVMSKFSRICFSFDFKSSLQHESSL
ncbi:retrovirus-related pol polyprotein from transposon TNT 1-94 [Tanacetum coccineum]